jgi:hypothetical protein
LQLASQVAHYVLCVFAFDDRVSYDGLRALVAKTNGKNPAAKVIAVGTKFEAKIEQLQVGQ